MNKKQQLPLVKSPDYTNYCAAFNSGYHDYNMSTVELSDKLGKAPRKYVELNAKAQVANLAHQNREAVAGAGSGALLVYDALMRGEDDLFRVFALAQPEGSVARQVLGLLDDDTDEIDDDWRESLVEQERDYEADGYF